MPTHSLPPRTAPAWALIVLLICAPAFATDAVSLSGTIVKDYEHRGEPPMQMPTAVSVTLDGTVAVADGVNDRVLQFSPDGTLTGDIREVGDAKLARPLAVRYDSTGRLWIADTGNDRIVVRGTDGALERSIPLADQQDGHHPDPVDVVPLDGGVRAWIVENDLHRLWQWDVVADPADFIAVGRHGSALGQFNYPFMAGVDSSGRIFVSDSLNGRVQAVSSTGKITGVIGSYGVGPGQLYRPKGVAVDRSDRVWVADGVMGVVQVFEPGGRFLAVLCDAADQPLKFTTPIGIAFGPQGHLYVVELSANRVREVRIAEQPRPRAVPGPSRAQAVAGAGQSPTCTVCHIEWMPALADGGRTAIMSVPDSRPDDPIVSRRETCLSCHDGSVMDSRRRVWREHGHQTGVVPPPAVKVPEYLPLVDGKLACRTCHSAHAGGNKGQSLAGALFVRVENGSGELCVSCHGEHTLGSQAGTHPTGGMPWAVPEPLIEAGAKIGPNPRELICYVCHTPHGSKEEHLLVMGTQSNQLCLTCHSKLRPGLWRQDTRHEHPQNPPLTTPAQKQAIVDMGTKTGPGDTLICLSCHKVHHGRSGRYILADTLTDSQLCMRCHPERANITNTAHDLRASAPQARNRIGQTAVQSGPCGACHTFHRFARMPDPQPHDPIGLCAACHQPGQCAGKVSFGAPGHPFQVKPEQLPAGLTLRTSDGPEGTNEKTISCLTCHNPHETGHKPFLVMPSEQLCAQCHQQPASSLTGGHKLTERVDIRNAKGRTPAEAGACAFCHAMHEAKGPALWGATAAPPADADGLCTSCHRADGLAAHKPDSKFHHPTGPETAEAAAKLGTNLPLLDDRGRQSSAGGVSCSSCHDPHGDAGQSPGLLRAGPPAAALCVNCHKEPAALAGGLHDSSVTPARWPEQSRHTDDLCLSCHLPHSDDPTRGLWTVSPHPEYAVADGACLGCHRHLEWDGHGTQPAAAGSTTQPGGRAPAPADHGLPLVPNGPGKTSGVIGCKTCHDPHGRPGEQPHLLRAGRALDPGAMCLRCHQELQYIGMSLHSRDAMKEFAGESGRGKSDSMLQCGPCHSVHAPEQSTQPVPGRLAHLPQDVQRCVGCHSAEGGATSVHIVHHFGPLDNVGEPGTPGFLPLINDDGAIGRSGRIACITCHAPHGRPPGPAFVPVEPGTITAEQLRAMMPMVSPYTAPNLCSSCHGFDGIVRFLYYHNPEKRGTTLPE